MPLLVLAAHAALLPQGQWLDEWLNFGLFRILGWRWMLARLVHWSPRPLSEPLLYVYWQAVRLSGTTAIVPALVLAWLALFGWIFWALRPWGRGTRPIRAMVWAGLPAAFMLSGPIGELYYWPFGALAYLPALGAASAAMLLIAGPGVGCARNWRYLIVALSAGALCVEMGAFLALALCPMLAAATLFRVRDRASLIRAAWLILPIVLSCLVVAGLWAGRLHGEAPPAASDMTGHHAGASLVAAFRQLGAEMLGRDDGAGGTGPSIPVRLIMALGFGLALRQLYPQAPPRLPMALAAIAILAAALLSIAGAYYTFGHLCCERHGGYRQALYVLLALVLGAAIVPRNGRDARPGLACALIAAALLLLSPMRLAALRAEWRLAPLQRAALAATFRSGRDRGGDGFVFFTAPSGSLLEGSHLDPGRYTLNPAESAALQGPMLFFGKHAMTVRPLTPP